SAFSRVTRSACGPLRSAFDIGVEDGPPGTRRPRSGRPTRWAKDVRCPRESRSSRRTLRRHVSRQVLVELRPHNSSGLLVARRPTLAWVHSTIVPGLDVRSEEHTSELQSRGHLVCRLLL